MPIPALLLALQPVAVPPADSAATSALNARILARNAAVADENARRDAGYRVERARYEAALADHARQSAAAVAAQRAYEAELAARLRPAEGKAAVPPAIATLPSGRKVRNASDQTRVDLAVSQHRKLVCRTTVDTGSLARRTRTCGTADSWRRRGVAEREAAQDMMMNNMGRPPGS